MTVDANGIVTGLVVAIVGGIIIAMLRQQNRQLEILQTTVNIINGRVVRVEEWKDTHEQRHTREENHARTPTS